MSQLFHRVPPLLLVILFFAFITRIWNLHLPQKYVFDEVYHAVTAKLIAHNDPRAYEWWNPPPEPETSVDWLHPPLAKYTQAIGMIAFGENPFGWRISSAAFGVLVIVMTYILAQKLFNSERVALLAAFLASLDGLLLVQSRVAMNDIHVTFFILLTLVIYLKYRQEHPQSWRWLLAAGVSAGLAVGTKWSGVFVLATIWFFEGVRFLGLLFKKKWKNQIPKTLAFIGTFVSLRFILLLIIPVCMYLASYTHMFIQGKSLICTENRDVPNICYSRTTYAEDGSKHVSYISHFQELHHQIWWYQTNLDATHSYQSRPWQWWLNLRPVWFAVEYVDQQTIANIYALGNPALFWIGNVALLYTMLVVGGSIAKNVWLRTKLKQIDVPQLLPTFYLLFSYFIVWLPWILSPRIMFFYHYTPAVPLLSIILAMNLSRLWGNHLSHSVKTFNWRQWVVVAVVISVGITFAIWYPHWTFIPVPKSFANTVYFALPSWK